MPDDSKRETTPMADLNGVIEQAYQKACNDMATAKRLNDQPAAARYIAAALALEDAYPDRIAAYSRATGATPI